MSIAFEVEVHLLIVVALSLVSQLFFGVGILLWGTPILLLMGYSYLETLSFLLPISISVSLVQTITDVALISRKLVLKFLIMAVPFLFMGLGVTLFYSLDAAIPVALVLFTIAVFRLGRFMSGDFLGNGLRDLLLPLLGLVHGISNLGGSILVPWVALSINSKNAIRVNIAAIYLVLGITQVLLLRAYGVHFKVEISYVIFAVLAHLTVTKKLVGLANEKSFELALNLLMIMISIVLIAK